MKVGLTIEVPDTIDPVDTDPHMIAEEMVDSYNEMLRANQRHGDQVTFLSAEWE